MEPGGVICSGVGDADSGGGTIHTGSLQPSSLACLLLSFMYLIQRMRIAGSVAVSGGGACCGERCGLTVNEAEDPLGDDTSPESSNDSRDADRDSVLSAVSSSKPSSSAGTNAGDDAATN